MNSNIMTPIPFIKDFEIMYPLTELIEDDYLYDDKTFEEIDKMCEEEDERRKDPIIFKIYNDCRIDLDFDKYIIMGCSYKKPNELLNELLDKFKRFKETYKGDGTDLTDYFKRAAGIRGTWTYDRAGLSGGARGRPA